MDYAILALQCAFLFVFGAACFDIVHYVLHVWENSRIPLLRFLGGLHGVHHKFMTKDMRIDRAYSLPNLLNHVVPEYLTGVAGVAVLGLLLFGWLPTAIVIAIRTLMVVVYLVQKGEDITHRELPRIRAQRNLFFVGPHYHALHHVYVYQHYSSFVSVFDLIFGTNCQIEGRGFFAGADADPQLVNDLKSRGGRFVDSIEEAEVLLQTDSTKNLIDRLRESGKNRLVPPEVWGPSKLPPDPDLTYRRIPRGTPANYAMFFIKRGVLSVPYPEKTA